MITAREWGNDPEEKLFYDVPISLGWERRPCRWADALFISPCGSIGIEINQHGDTVVHWIFIWDAAEQPHSSSLITPRSYAPVFRRHYVDTPEKLRGLLENLTKEYEEKNGSE